MLIKGKTAGVVADEQAAAVRDTERAKLRAQLEELSARFPRHLEDLHELTGAYPAGIDAAEAAKITGEKETLRARLRAISREGL